MKTWNDDAFSKGASMSLQKTIVDLDAILDGRELQTEGPLREKLRKSLTKALERIAKDWLEHGFNGGHIVTVQEFLKSGSIPIVLSKSIERQFPVRGTGTKQPLKVTSKLPTKLKDRLRGGTGA
jgi:hypothetical protein